MNVPNIAKVVRGIWILLAAVLVISLPSTSYADKHNAKGHGHSGKSSYSGKKYSGKRDYSSKRSSHQRYIDKRGGKKYSSRSYDNRGHSKHKRRDAYGKKRIINRVGHSNRYYRNRYNYYGYGRHYNRSRYYHRPYGTYFAAGVVLGSLAVGYNYSDDYIDRYERKADYFLDRHGECYQIETRNHRRVYVEVPDKYCRY